jgi:hypothetical protein
MVLFINLLLFINLFFYLLMLASAISQLMMLALTLLVYLCDSKTSLKDFTLIGLTAAARVFADENANVNWT